MVAFPKVEEMMLGVLTWKYYCCSTVHIDRFLVVTKIRVCRSFPNISKLFTVTLLYISMNISEKKNKVCRCFPNTPFVPVSRMFDRRSVHENGKQEDSGFSPFPKGEEMILRV